MFSYSIYSELFPTPKSDLDLFTKKSKLSDFKACKKKEKIQTIAWNKKGSKLVVGSSDSVITV